VDLVPLEDPENPLLLEDLVLLGNLLLPVNPENQLNLEVLEVLEVPVVP
jgi:hypothetical protein